MFRRAEPLEAADKRAIRQINKDIDKALKRARRNPMTSPFLTERPLAWYEKGWIMIALAVLVAVCTVVAVMLVAGRLLR